MLLSYSIDLATDCFLLPYHGTSQMSIRFVACNFLNSSLKKYSFDDTTSSVFEFSRLNP